LEVSGPLLAQGGSSSSALIAELSSLNYESFIVEDSRISPFVAIPEYHTVDCLCVYRGRAPDVLTKLNLRGFQV